MHRSRRPRSWLLGVFAVGACGDNDAATPGTEGGDVPDTAAEASGDDGGSSEPGGTAASETSNASAADDTSDADTTTGVQTLPCDGLAGVGEWQNITPPGLTCGTTAIVVDAANEGVAYVGGGDGCPGFSDGIFATSDCGATWTKANTDPSGAPLDTGDQWSMVFDANMGAMLTTAGYGANGVYRSVDGGIAWQEVTPTEPQQNFVGAMTQDPTDPSHVFVNYHNAPCTPAGSTGDDQIGCFSETKDAGLTWTVHYADPDWTVAKWSPGVMVYPLHGDTWIIAEEGLQRTTDAGQSWETVSDASAGGHSSGFLYLATTGVYYLVQGGGGGIIRSDDDGVTWTPIPDTGVWGKGITGSGTSMFASVQAGIRTAPENDDATWALMPGSPTHSDGCYLAHDDGHHLLYASCMGEGLWRMRTE